MQFHFDEDSNGFWRAKVDEVGRASKQMCGNHLNDKRSVGIEPVN